MANKGTNTNQSQFFITFRPCKYLDKKHSIFGRVVGGQDTLNSIERVETEGNAEKEAEAKRDAAAKPKAFGSGVGKYINPQNKRPAVGDASSTPVLLKKKAVKTSLSDFSSW
ncbi:hypothetical protein OSTOST_14013 [Ostertagia ostertagi]